MTTLRGKMEITDVGQRLLDDAAANLQPINEAEDRASGLGRFDDLKLLESADEFRVVHDRTVSVMALAYIRELSTRLRDRLDLAPDA